MIETDIYVAGQSTYDRQDGTATVYENYLQDTETLASLEARDAIAMGAAALPAAESYIPTREAREKLGGTMVLRSRFEKIAIGWERP